jgi:predicted O-methyltransferase YrrM
MRRYDHILRRARVLRDAGDLAGAELLYRKLLAEQSDDTVAMHNLSVVLFEQGRRREANAMLTQVLNKNNDFPEYFATMAAFLGDPAFSEELQNSWGGPFNGQPMRRDIFLDIARLTAPASIFETGTYRGATAHFMAHATPAHVFSCESQIDNFHFARRRLAGLANVSLFRMDSRAFLRRHVPLFHAEDRATFFYLDAHWQDDLPLLDELLIVFEQAPRSVVMIDDFQVPDDPGYVFDDYGAGKRLCLDYLAPLARFGPRCFLPGPSAEEGGYRRGCVVLTIDAALAEVLGRVDNLRPAPNAGSSA